MIADQQRPTANRFHGVISTRPEPGERRRDQLTRKLRLGGLLLVMSAALAFTTPAAAGAAVDPAPCGPPVTKAYPIGRVQYCPLYGRLDAWVPVYATRDQGSNRIGIDIIGWLTHRGTANWFWCQMYGPKAWNEWRTSHTWAKTLTDIEAGPPHAPSQRQGWVPETFFHNATEPDGNGNTYVYPDSNLAWARGPGEIC